MSLTFTQITEIIDENCKSNTATYPITSKTRDINLALDYIYGEIFKAGGRWQFDDSNHVDNPIVKTTLTAGQRNYAFTTDEQGNLILDIYKVMVMNEAGVYEEAYPVDVRQDPNVESFFDGQEIQGSVYRYTKTANGIFLDQVPSYTKANGIKIFINREGSYFLITDTTKSPGFVGLYHEYLALRPSYKYALRNDLKNINGLKAEMTEFEEAIKQHYRDRSRDEVLSLSAEDINSI